MSLLWHLRTLFIGCMDGIVSLGDQYKLNSDGPYLSNLRLFSSASHFNRSAQCNRLPLQATRVDDLYSLCSFVSTYTPISVSQGRRRIGNQWLTGGGKESAGEGERENEFKSAGEVVGAGRKFQFKIIKIVHSKGRHSYTTLYTHYISILYTTRQQTASLVYPL